MPLQEFWNEDPDLLWVYRTCYVNKLKQDIKIQREMINFQGWLQGLYNYRAIVSSLSKEIKYYEEPIDFNAKPKNKLEIARKIKERTMQGKMILEQQRRENKG